MTHIVVNIATEHSQYVPVIIVATEHCMTLLG